MTSAPRSITKGSLERHHDRLPPVFDHHDDRPAIGQLIKRVQAVVHLISCRTLGREEHSTTFTGSQDDNVKHGVGAAVRSHECVQPLQPIRLLHVNNQTQIVVHQEAASPLPEHEALPLHPDFLHALLCRPEW